MARKKRIKRRVGDNVRLVRREAVSLTHEARVFVMKHEGQLRRLRRVVPIEERMRDTVQSLRWRDGEEPDEREMQLGGEELLQVVADVLAAGGDLSAITAAIADELSDERRAVLDALLARYRQAKAAERGEFVLAVLGALMGVSEID